MTRGGIETVNQFTTEYYALDRLDDVDLVQDSADDVRVSGTPSGLKVRIPFSVLNGAMKERLETIEAKLDDTLRHLHRLDAATTEASNALTAAGVLEVEAGRCLTLAERIGRLHGKVQTPHVKPETGTGDSGGDWSPEILGIS
jgi:hypothetical protein